MKYEEKIDTHQYKNHVINIGFDTDAESPRSWDNIGTMVCFHSRYCLGDEHDLRANDFYDWDEIQRYIRKTYKPVIMYDLYLYDHGGISISTKPFSCRWDSGKIGFIYATKADILKAYGAKRLTKKLLSMAQNSILDEVNIYDSYLNGEVYRYEVVSKTGKMIDTCNGYYGDLSQNPILQDAKAFVDSETSWRRKHKKQMLQLAR